MNRTASHIFTTATEQERIMRTGSVSLAWAIVATVLTLAPARAIEVVDFHPRLFLHESDLPNLRARVGVADGSNALDYADHWNTYTEEYASLLGEIAEAQPVLEVSTGEFWSIADARKYTRWLGNLAFAYLLNARTLDAEPFVSLSVQLWQLIIDDSRARNGGSIGRSLRNNEFGKNANWAGFCMSYDYLYDVLASEQPVLRDEIARWLFAQIEDGYDYIGGNGSTPVADISHYYKWPWVADGVIGGLLTLHGDPSVDPVLLAEMLEWTEAFKHEDNLVRAKNYCGTYSGYRPERIEEDVVSALALASSSNVDPFVTYSYHYANLDDWVMHMCRPNYFESDETGHSHDLGPLAPSWVHFSYPSAVRDANPYTLWFLDQAQQVVGLSRKGWVNILFNDKVVARQQPTLYSYPLGRYFGDTTPDDGYNSQYTHFRSRWAFDVMESSTVHATYLCGAFINGHDLFSQGHLAIFRGSDILTASTGIYDGTAMPHTRYWHQAPVSENTILVVDRRSPYYADLGDSIGVVYHREGMQAQADGTTGGSGFTDADGPFQRKYASGFVERFSYLDNGDTYVYSDITHAYPNTDHADLWPEYQTVESVTRQITFQHGNYFVVVDRVTSTSPDAIKRIIMHAPDQSGYTLLDGAWTGGVDPHPVENGGTPGQWTEDGLRYAWSSGGSRAFGTVLYPAPVERSGPGRKLVRVGGTNSAGEWNVSGDASDPSFEFWLREVQTNYRWSDLYINPTEEAEAYDNGWVGFWRMEIEATGREQHTFLHVYEITGAAQSIPTNVDYLAEVDVGHVGCSIDDPRGRRVNLYSRDEIPDEGVFYRTSLDGPIRHLVADLQAGVYLVEALDTSESFTLAVSEGEHVASFETEQGGTFRVTRLPDLAARR